jgi:prevent-host-death family protein
MRVVSITEVRQDATKLIDEATSTHEPILVIQRSRPAVYLVDAERYEAMERDLYELRRQSFWQEVDEAWAEHERGESPVYDNVESMIADLGLDESAEPPAPATDVSERTRPRRRRARAASSPA